MIRTILPLATLTLLTTPGCWTQQETPGGADSDIDADSDADADTDSDVDLLGPDFVDDLDNIGGCGDLYIYACGEYGAGEVALFFVAQGYVLEMYEAGLDMMDANFAMPSADAQLTVAVGTNLCDAECVDIPAPQPPVVWETFAPVSGNVLLSLVPQGTYWDEWYTPAWADLTLSGITFASDYGDEGDPVYVEELHLEGISVGWLPG